jgi:hypothetical protein
MPVTIISFDWKYEQSFSEINTAFANDYNLGPIGSAPESLVKSEDVMCYEEMLCIDAVIPFAESCDDAS